jgi:hypothetical protein
MSMNWSERKGHCLGCDQRLRMVQPVHRLQTEVASGDLPFVVLFLEHCANQADDRSLIREDAHHTGK